VLVDERGRLADQSSNPHVAGWIYRVLREERPIDDTIPARAVPVSIPVWLDVDPI
jgi:hypothetical protein